MARGLGLGERGRQGVPALLGEDVLGEVGDRLAQDGGLPQEQGTGEASASLMEHGERVASGGAVGGAKVLGGLLGGVGLLRVALP